MAAPVGSALRDKALADLAALNDSGLDPLLLGANKLADVYLKLSPAAPAAPTDHAVTVTANPPVTAAGFQAFPDKVASAEFHSQLNACWDAYNAATKKDTMVVNLPIRNVFVASQYDDEPGGYAFQLEPATGLSGADATADSCVRAAVGDALTKVHGQAGFQTKLVVTVK
jgi:hypothetical protein